MPSEFLDNRRTVAPPMPTESQPGKRKDGGDWKGGKMKIAPFDAASALKAESDASDAQMDNRRHARAHVTGISLRSVTSVTFAFQKRVSGVSSPS
jgi:hypothetical protein